MTNDKVAIVTGGSKGIGKAIALELARNGIKVCLVSRQENNLQRALEELRGVSEQNHLSIAGDVSEPSFANTVIDHVLNSYGRIDILINNSGGPTAGSFLEKDEMDWHAAIQNNLMSVIRFSKKVAPIMINQKWGRILNITSTLAKEPTPSMVLSSTTRSAVSAFTKAIADELAIHNITVNTICPGGVLTDRLNSLIIESAQKNNISVEEQLLKNQALIPIKRFAQPEEIANMAAFIVSEKGSYLTGQSIALDGGLSRSYF